MDTNRWTHDPVGAFRAWQETAATGADRRPFAPRSVVQHVAMFERFLRHLIAHRVSLATFGPDHVAAFLAELERTCAPGTSTRVRYAKLIDRLGRHLVEAGIWSRPACARFIRPAGRRVISHGRTASPNRATCRPMPTRRFSTTCSLDRTTRRPIAGIARSSRCCSRAASLRRRYVQRRTTRSISARGRRHYPCRAIGRGRRAGSGSPNFHWRRSPHGVRARPTRRHPRCCFPHRAAVAR